MPFVLYFLAAFVAPPTDKERKVVRPACFAAFLLFLTVCSLHFLLFFRSPVVFVRLNMFFDFDLFWAASDYYSMVVWFSLATGAFFSFLNNCNTRLSWRNSCSEA